MNWYLAKIVFNIDIENGTHHTQFDEQIRLITATSSDDAFFKARALGKREEEVFVNENKKLVHWKFIDVSEIESLQNLQDGASIHSSTVEMEHVNDYINFVKHKAMIIQSKNKAYI